eukprot:TRINITY_DN4614_c0_g2_i4.p1 TRINITY_DN4614_c0_g2~~TRINITY_DN4614_c0_g2_i4.p1  ORF type:complete len:399 (+),score=86.70 TRINITY_DN4614_c0_g2_i4:137-1333(+)
MQRNRYQDSNIFGTKPTNDPFLSPDYKRGLEKQPGKAHVQQSPTQIFFEGTPQDSSLRKKEQEKFEPRWEQKSAQQRRVQEFHGAEYTNYMPPKHAEINLAQSVDQLPPAEQRAMFYQGGHQSGSPPEKKDRLPAYLMTNIDWKDPRAYGKLSNVIPAPQDEKNFHRTKKNEEWNSTIFGESRVATRPQTAQVNVDLHTAEEDPRRKYHNYSDLFGNKLGIPQQRPAENVSSVTTSKQFFEPQGYKEIKQRSLAGSMESPFYTDINARMERLKLSESQVLPEEGRRGKGNAGITEPVQRSPPPRLETDPGQSFYGQGAPLQFAARRTPQKVVEREVRQIEVKGLSPGYDVVQLRRDLINEGIQVVKIDEKINTVNNSCLLYTSPSPRDRQKSRMPSSA